MLMGRRLRSRLDLLYPSIATRVESHQEKQKESHDTKRPLRTFQVGDLVYAENFSGLPKWIPASIVKVTGPLSYELELSDSKEIKWRRHVDSIRGREQHDSERKSCSPEISAPTQSDTPAYLLPNFTPDPPPPPPPPPPPLRRSTRNRQPPDRY